MSEAQRAGDMSPEEGAPTGLSLLVGNEARVQILDALLGLPPHREFNKSELAEFADVSRKTVHNHFHVLDELGLVTPVEGTTPTRYRFDTENEISEQLIRLDAAVNSAGPGFDEE